MPRQLSRSVCRLRFRDATPEAAETRTELCAQHPRPGCGSGQPAVDKQFTDRGWEPYVLPWHLTASAQAVMVSGFITELIPYDRLHAVRSTVACGRARACGVAW